MRTQFELAHGAAGLQVDQPHVLFVEAPLKDACQQVLIEIRRAEVFVALAVTDRRHQLPRHHLDRDRPGMADVPSQEHRGHPASPELALDGVAPCQSIA